MGLLKPAQVGSGQTFIRCAVRISAGILCNLIEAYRGFHQPLLENALQQPTAAPLHTLSNTLRTITQASNHVY